MLQRRATSAGIVYYFSPLIEQIGVPHAFSTRRGGVSAAPFDSMNLGNPTGCEFQDDDAHIRENYRRLQSAIGCESRERSAVHQVHGGKVVTAMRGEEILDGAQADAIVSDDPQRVLSIRVADCVPILIANEEGRIVAAVHAGWRGVVAEVVPNAVRKLIELGCRADRLIAAVGPCISEEAFEVGAEVLDAFARLFGSDAPLRHTGDGKGRVNLARAVEMQLIHSGIAVDRIDLSDRCTFRDREECFSHRRDKGVTGRMAAVIGCKV